MVSKQFFAMFVLCSITFCCNKQAAFGQSSDSLLRDDISSGQTAEADQSLITAFKQKRKDLLMLGLSNPDLRTQVEAAELICNLADQEISDALVVILQRNSLWIEQIDGSRNVSMQKAFVETVKTGIGRSMHDDFSSSNLFDSQTRSDIVNRLKTKHTP